MAIDWNNFSLSSQIPQGFQAPTVSAPAPAIPQWQAPVKGVTGAFNVTPAPVATPGTLIPVSTPEYQQSIKNLLAMITLNGLLK